MPGLELALITAAARLTSGAGFCLLISEAIFAESAVALLLQPVLGLRRSELLEPLKVNSRLSPAGAYTM